MTMSTTCVTDEKAGVERQPAKAVAPVEAPVETLLQIARLYGTPTYAYDVARLRAQVNKLRTNLPEAVEILYSLKANASLGICSILAGCRLGVDVASAGELVTAQAAGFPPHRIYLTGPDKSPAVRTELAGLPDALLSLDSVSELALFAKGDQQRRVVLRLRPDFCSYATCSTGPDSRFGLTFEDLPRCRDYLKSRGVRVVGFHVFSGSQVLSSEGIIHHLRGGLDLALRATNTLGVTPEIIDIGGGFGIPYGPDDSELDLAMIGAELQTMVAQAAPAKLVIELGRYFVAQAGWYLTTVIGEQTHRGRKAVVVDGGSHQRADICGIGLRHKGFPPRVLDQRQGSVVATDVLGCLSLPADVLVEASPLPPVSVGDVLAFPNAGAYGLWSSPALFHGHPLPAEVAFEGSALEVFRQRRPIRSILEGQAVSSFGLPDL
jgi:diaminopimelate decarboxylase